MYEGRFEQLRRAGWGAAKMANYFRHLDDAAIERIDNATTQAEAKQLIAESLAEQKATVEEEQDE